MDGFEKIIIDDTNENWRAVIFLGETSAELSFLTKPSEIPIQGDIDGVLGFEDIPTGIDGIVMFADDGSFMLDLDGYAPEQVNEKRQQIIDYFKNLYEEKKSLFKKGVEDTLKEYDSL